MANLVPSVIGLDKGLNLQTAKLVAPAGSVLDTLNYEQVDFQGQKRIDGFQRYDGHAQPAIDDYYVITMSANFLASGAARLFSNGNFFGMLVDSNSSSPVLYAVSVNDNFIPTAGDILSYYDPSMTLVEGTVVSVVKGIDSGVTVDQHYTKLLDLSANLRDRVGELPGPIAGLHWFRDRLYAVAGVTAVSLSGITPIIYPNDVLTLAGINYNVLDAYVLDNTRLVFVDALYPDEWQVEGTAVTRNAVSVGTVANGYEDLTTELATFFESRTEAQVIAEDGIVNGPSAGWVFKHLGWEVPFESGLSLYGSLPSLNQNIVGLGTQGPTPITGNNGKPLLLVQKVAVTGKPTQVNGWKSSDNSESYDLDAGNVAEDDSLYVYADAYVSWTEDSDSLQAPGLTTATLTEYPANNTVVVEIP